MKRCSPSERFPANERPAADERPTANERPTADERPAANERPTADKWLKHVGPNDSVAKIARRTLRHRLKAVAYYLPLAADHAQDDSEYVHQLRVATRRAMAALELFRDQLPKRRRKAMKRVLRRIRKAAGVARDLDVMLLHEDGRADELPTIMRRLRDQRQSAQQPIVDICRKLQGPAGLAKRTRRLLPSARKGPRDGTSGRVERLGPWARKQLRPLVKKFFRAAPRDTSDLRELHQFRIRGKQLRYATELLSGGFPKTLRKDLVPRVEDLQERLGAINDLATSLARLRSWQAATQDSREARRLAELQHQTEQQLDRCLEEFIGWWTPELANDLKIRFRALLFRDGGSATPS